jgi:hypothetical protein
LSTATALLINKQLGELEEVAADQGWTVKRLAGLRFVLGVPAKDGTWLYIRCEPEEFPTLPPAWRWSDELGESVDEPRLTGIGGNFFHGNGVICAPWNRLAYQAQDSRGPHPEWVLGDWTQNQYTRQCLTLTAMASRIAVEALTNYSERTK